MHECETKEKQYCPYCGGKLFEEVEGWEDITEYVRAVPRVVWGMIIIDIWDGDEVIGYFCKTGFHFTGGRDGLYQIEDSLPEAAGHQAWMKVYRRV